MRKKLQNDTFAKERSNEMHQFTKNFNGNRKRVISTQNTSRTYPIGTKCFTLIIINNLKYIKHCNNTHCGVI